MIFIIHFICIDLSVTYKSIYFTFPNAEYRRRFIGKYHIVFWCPFRFFFVYK